MNFLQPLYWGISCVVAYCSMNYELLLAQALSIMLGHSFLHFTLTIGLYLFCLGMGSLLLSLRSRPGSWREFILLELALSGIGILLPALIFALDSPYIMYSVVATVGVLSGWEIPLLVELVRSEQGDAAAEKIIAWDYAGTFLAAVMFPLVISRYLGLVGGCAFTALLNCSAAFLLVVNRGRKKHCKEFYWTLAGVLLCLGVLFNENTLREIIVSWTFL